MHKFDEIPAATDLSRMHDAGVGVVRFQLTWRQVEPNAPDDTPVIGTGHTYDWSAPDEIVRRVVSAGLRAHFVVYGTPAWINRDQRAPAIATQADRDNWAAFLTAAAQRYGTGGDFFVENPEVPNKSVRDWQIWNEENSSVRYLPKVDPAGYAQLVRIASGALNGVDPGIRVILGGMFGTPGTPGSMAAWDYLQALYKTPNFASSYDMVAVHPYSPDLYGVRYQIQKIRRVLRKNNDAGRKMQITEVGWSSASPRADGHLFVGQRGQARLLRQSFKMFMKKRHRWHLRRVIWFSWRDPDAVVSDCTFCARSGLLRNGGKPKRAFRQYLKVTGGSG